MLPAPRADASPCARGPDGCNVPRGSPGLVLRHGRQKNAERKQQRCPPQQRPGALSQPRSGARTWRKSSARAAATTLSTHHASPPGGCGTLRARSAAPRSAWSVRHLVLLLKYTLRGCSPCWLAARAAKRAVYHQGSRPVRKSVSVLRAHMEHHHRGGALSLRAAVAMHWEHAVPSVAARSPGGERHNVGAVDLGVGQSQRLRGATPQEHGVARALLRCRGAAPPRCLLPNATLPLGHAPGGRGRAPPCPPSCTGSRGMGT